jgi:TorA maturation chaperone TorD
LTWIDANRQWGRVTGPFFVPGEPMSDYAPDEPAARVDLCRFLSACFYEPGVEFAEEKLFDSIHTAALQLSPDLAGHASQLRAAFFAQDLQTLLVDYTRLFLGPLETLASPYGSAWSDAQPNAEESPLPGVLALFEKGGFDLDPEFMDRPDHVAVELEFLYVLTFNKNQADRDGKLDEAAATEQLRQQFLSEHLGAWIVPFSAAVTANAQTAFYRELAAFSRSFVQAEMVRPVVH